MCHVKVQQDPQQSKFNFDFGGNTSLLLDIHEIKQLSEHCRQILSKVNTNPYYDTDEDSSVVYID